MFRYDQTTYMSLYCLLTRLEAHLYALHFHSYAMPYEKKTEKRRSNVGEQDGPHTPPPDDGGSGNNRIRKPSSGGKNIKKRRNGDNNDHDLESPEDSDETSDRSTSGNPIGRQYVMTINPKNEVAMGKEESKF